MKQINEQVLLPDPKTHFLVHPLDVAPARRPYLISWVLGIIGSPQVFAAAAALGWVLSNNFVVPFLAGGSTLILGNLAATYFRRQAWSFVPGKRRDTERRLRGLDLAAAVLEALALAAAMLMLILWFANRDISPEVVAFAAGTVGAVAALMAIDVVVTAVRTRSGAAVLGPLVNLLAVAAASWWGFLVIAGRTGPLSWSLVAAGALVLLFVWALWLLWWTWQQRRIGQQGAPKSAPKS